MEQAKSSYHLSESALETEYEQIISAKKDSRKFEVLYIKYFEDIFRYIQSRTGNINTSKDICQQVFLKALQNLKKYEFKGVPFSSWLYRIAYSELNQNYRNFKQEIIITIHDHHLKDPELFADYDQSKETKINTLKQALSDLNKEDIELIEFRYFEKRSVKEIAAILNLSESNVKVKTHRALKKLKAHHLLKELKMKL